MSNNGDGVVPFPIISHVMLFLDNKGYSLPYREIDGVVNGKFPKSPILAFRVTRWLEQESLKF